MAAAAAVEPLGNDPAQVDADHDPEPPFPLPSELENGGTIPYWKIEACPAAHCCSPKSWKRADKSSFVSPEKCRWMVMNHLISSGHHEMKRADALALVCDELVVVKELYETQEDRDKQRAWVADQQEQKAAHKREQHQKKDQKHSQPTRSGTSSRIWLQVSSRRCAGSEAAMTR